jgi:hypothetical protein
MTDNRPLTFGEKIRTLQFRGSRSAPRPGVPVPGRVESRDDDGRQVRATHDDLGHTVIERAGDRQDVIVRPETVKLRVTQSG